MELAQSCTNTASLTTAYQSVINKYHVNHLDFDVEGAAIADTASINRRYQAIKTLEANNAGLVVSVTIPVLQSGPDGNGTAFLQAAKTNGTRIDRGQHHDDGLRRRRVRHGCRGDQRRSGTFSIARTIWPSFGYGNLGITPMIGQNDQSGEIFTIANAQSVVSFANSNGVGRLAFWSIGRDQQCPGGAGGGASPNCSSISQSTLQFTGIFNGSTIGTPAPTPTGTTPTPTPTHTTTPTPTPTGAYPSWVVGHAYKVGDRVSYGGHNYQCLQAHTSQADWTPPAVPALWQLLS